MTIKEIRLSNLNRLIEELYINKDESMHNIIAYEITCRMYVPFKGIEFDELLKSNGYIERDKASTNKVLTKKSK